MKSLIAIALLFSLFSQAQDGSNLNINVDLDGFSYSSTRGRYYWPVDAESNPVLEIDSHPNSPLFSAESILFNLNSKIDGSTYLFENSSFFFNVMIDISVSIPFDSRIGGYAKVACTINNGTPFNVANGSSRSLLIEANSETGSGNLGCFLTFGYLASVRITKITLIPKPVIDALTGLNSSNSCSVLGHSYVNIDTLSLHENIPLVGVPFDINYSSLRLNKNFNFPIKDFGLGGWTPSLLHFYDTSNKMLYLGDGNHRPVIASSWGSSGFYVTDSSASEVYFFDEDGYLIQTKNVLTGVVKYSFDYSEEGKISSITDSYGNMTSFIYQGTNVIINSPYNQQTILALDGNQNLISVTNPNNEVYLMDYNTNNLMTSFTKPEGQKSFVSYDSNGLVTKDLGAGGDFIELIRSYDSDTKIQSVSVSNALGIKTEYETKALSKGAERSVTYPSGEEIYLTNHDQEGNNSSTSSVGSNYSATQAQDPLFGWMAPYENESSYSIVNSPINIHESVTKSAILSDPNNPFSFTQLTTTQTLQNDPARTSKTIYNTSDRTLTSISPMNRVMQQKLSDHGDVSELKIGSLESIKFDYDSRGRIKNIQQGARITNFSYDSLGNVSSAKDSLGHETQYSYDLAGRIIKKTLSNGNEIRFRYDKNGNLIGLTPPSKQEHTFVYNLFELVTEYLPPELANGLLTETKYTYDLGSKLTQITRPDGLVVKLNYNSNTDLLTSINTPAGDYTYSYIDQSSLVKQAKSPYGQQLDYGYFGKVLASETTTGLVNSSLSYDYNTDGSLKSYSVGNQIVNSTYDNDKLLTGIGSLQLERNDFGAISKVKLQRLEGTYAYSSLGELKKQTYKYRGRTLSDESYDRDNLGRIIKIKSQFPRTQEGFEYDQQGRLVRVYHRNHLVRVYQYDDNGNRVKKWENGRLITADYDSQDRLIRYGNKRYEYNNNGDLSAVIENDRFHEKWHESKKEKHHNEHGKFSRNNKTNYKYDVFGNLVSVEFANGRKIEYLIDAQNRRVGKKVNGKLEVGYVYNGKTQIVAELDSQGNIVKQFIYGSKMNTPDYMIYKNKEYAIISDQVGTPEYLVDANTGGYREVYYYDEFGNTQREDHRISLLPFGFAGGLYDKDTGLVRFGARDYNPTIGRWTTKDPIGFNGGDTNLFGYVQNDPVNWIDPMGLFKLPKDPSGLGPGWKQDPNHTPGNGGGRWHYKGGKRFLEFHPGKPGAGGKQADDHWHDSEKAKGKWEKCDKHLKPGDEVPDPVDGDVEMMLDLPILIPIPAPIPPGLLPIFIF